MNIAIVVATPLEERLLKQVFDQQHINTANLSVTGVGLTAATYSILHMALTTRPALIIQVGIAGGFTAAMPLGRAVAVQSEIVADMGVEENGLYSDIFALGLEEKNRLPYRDGKLINPHQALLINSCLPLVDAVSVNEITVDQKRIDRFVQQYGADLESMEGMALHHVCIQQQIPFLQIRGISNRVGERNKSAWLIKESMQAAALACAELLINPESRKHLA